MKKPFRPGTPRRTGIRSGPGPRRGSGLARGSVELKRGRIRRQNASRQKRERERAYGPPERRAWVAAQPCVVARCERTPSQNAHIESDGMGRKADADKVVPMCHTHHRRLHAIGTATFEDRFGLSLYQLAANTEAAWRAHVGAAAA